MNSHSRDLYLSFLISNQKIEVVYRIIGIIKKKECKIELPV